MLKQQDTPRQPPPLVHVVGANVGPTTVLPQDGVIQVAFDRYLNPSSVNRQGVALRDLFGNAPDSPIIDYDPITRVITLSNPNPGQTWLALNQSYELVFPVPGDASTFGLLAIDGAPMAPTTNIAFMVGAPTGAPPMLPKINFCTDVIPIFRAATPDLVNEGACGSKSCHGIPKSTLTTAQGLVLDNEDGIRHTAIGILATEAATGALTTALAPQAIFPVGMPIIDPGNPGNSFLLYKLMKADNGIPDASGASWPYQLYPGCNPTTITGPFAYGPGPGLAETDETMRLADLVPGRRMPWNGTALTIDEMERIRLWILQGAEVVDCTQCPACSPTSALACP